ncbi:MAG: two-component regulator propeller domain-containing protein [Bacteroidota bacterium]|nr:two-component regulator propeller domain-containing protein [Bacteroidota bacterium]
MRQLLNSVMGIFHPKPICIAGCLVLSASLLFGQQDINIEKVEGEGLTNYYIKCITQDKRGFLWFGTEEGLFRYDGYQFEPIKNIPGDTGTISNNNIEFLLPEENGSVWIGSRGGLSCVDSKTLQLKNFPAEQVFTVYSLVPKTGSSFYAGTSIGLFEFSKKTHIWKKAIGFPGNIFIRSLTADGKGNLIVTSHQGLYSYNIITGSCTRFDLPVPKDQKRFASQTAHRSILGQDGNIWITTWNSGLIRLDGATGKLSAFLTPNLDKTLEQYRSCYDLFQDNDGKIWMANSENGITLFDPRQHSSVSYRVQWGAEKEISGRVYALYKDKAGTCWIGTENGIYKNDPHSVRFATINYFPTSKGKPLRPDFTALCTLKDKDGDWWMGSYEGLFLFDPLTGNLKDYSSEAGVPAGTNVFNLLQDSTGDIWLTTRNKIMRLEKKSLNGKISFVHKTYESPAIQSNIITTYVDHRKRIWLGTNHSGVSVFDPSTGTFTSYPCSDTMIPVNKNEIRCFYELPGGVMLVGGENTGLLQLFPAENRYQKVDGFNKRKDGVYFTVNAIAGDDQGNLWIGTEGKGLWRTDEQFRGLLQYTIRDGFPSMNITALLPDVNDHLWILSEGGVVDYRPRQKKITLFDKAAGIRNLYNMFFISKTGNGNIAIGDMGCVHVYTPPGLSKNLLPPAVMITGFKIFDTPYPFPDNGTIELNYNQNYFSFEYTALDYTKPSHNVYSYMLEGIDTKWHDAASRRYVSYANLEEGTYTFKVKARNSEGIWNETPATLHLVIRPPFWNRWWFYLLILLAAWILIGLVYFIKQRQLKSKEQLRNKIARDLHDDIGSTLSGINIFSKIALQKLPTDQRASGELLQRINTRTEKTMEALSDIVWSINTRKDNMDNVLSRMREYLGEVIEPLGIQYEFLTGEGVHNVHIGMEIRKEVYMIFKEAIHNASKYAACSFIRIELRKENRSLLLLIKDNGKGFDIRSVVPGNGIYNMQERAEKIEAYFEISSEINKGTAIRLLFPIT